VLHLFANGNEIKLASSVKVERHTVVVPEGKDMKLILADGTQVWLNANSRLIYPTAFKGKNREVELQGEGYFKVTHDAYHPFIVKAGDMQTSVLGTEFNVNAFDQSNPHVTLVEGSVKVSSVLTHKTETQVAGKIIVPGEDAVLNEQGKIIVSHVDTDDVACWKDGIQLFNDASLREIVLQLGSWYNVNVVCHDESLLNTHLRYMYNRRNGIEEAIKMLNDISNNKIKLKNNTILIE
jgi:transmembrane sensor